MATSQTRALNSSIPGKKNKSPGWVRRAKAILREKNWSVPDLAVEMGHERGDAAAVDRLYKILQGKVENPRGTVMSNIAHALGVPEKFLRYGSSSAGDDQSAPRARGIVEFDVRAGLGGGGTMEGREVKVDGDFADPVKDEAWQFPARFIREELRAVEMNLRVIETQGDSMAPTILSGDRVIVDTGHRVPSPDGIYALRDQFGFIVVKRLQVMRSKPPVIRIISDNKAHDAEDVGADDIAIVGRVLWGLKRL